MTLRQAQRVLAELIAKCEAAHLVMPQDPFEARARAIRALQNSRDNGKVNVSDALEELHQTLEIEPQWQKKLDEEADKKRRRQLAARKRKTSSVREASPTSSGATRQRTRSDSSTNSDEKANKPITQVIKERNPAKNPANKELADQFVDLGGLELKRGQKQKGISRMRVAKELRNLEEPVQSGEQAKTLPGVGKSAAAKIDEYLSDGKIDGLEEYQKESSEGADDDNSISFDFDDDSRLQTGDEGSEQQV